MAILEVRDLKKEFGGNIIFDNVNFSVNVKEKVAIIGNNGSGKTTLLKLLTGELTKDGGSITYASNTSLGYLSQSLIEDYNNTLYDEMLNAFKDIIKLEKKLQNTLALINDDPHNKTYLEEYGRLESRFLALNGYDYSYLIDSVLSKFGFKKSDYTRSIMSFSGGERSKVAFAKLLLNKPNILLLDEPTNHLDVSTIEWLEEYLSSYEGSVIIVSHDRYFIDNVSNRIFEMVNHCLNIYEGNYSYYLQEKVLRYEQQLQSFKAQQKEISNLEQLIARFKPKPNKVKLAKDREKKLERIKENLIEKPSLYSKKVNFKLKDSNLHRVRQLTIENLAVGYNNNPLIKGISLEVFYGDKIGIIGNNGIGKTTILKSIYGTLPLIEGKIVKHRNLKIGYIDQNQINISSSKTIFDYFSDLFPFMDNTAIRTHLGSFLFQQDDVFKTIDMLSGGEKVRVSFAVLVMQKYDILLLDEPTNHLDMETKKILESTLKDYSGTIIFISHDRYFIDELATKICAINEDYTFNYYECNYQDYLDLTKSNDTVSLNTSGSQVKKTKKKDDNKQVSQQSILEKKITDVEAKLDTFRKSLYLEEVYSNLDRLHEVEDQIKVLEKELNELESEYFSLEENDNNNFE